MGASYWLLKTEPTHYSFADLIRDKRTTWDGIKNALALQNLRRAKKGDLALIYHTGQVRSAVGIGRIVSAPYPDPQQTDPKMAVVDLQAVTPLTAAVSLAEIKKHPALKEIDLIRLPRLSVVPLNSRQWGTLLKLARTRFR